MTREQAWKLMQDYGNAIVRYKDISAKIVRKDILEEHLDKIETTGEALIEAMTKPEKG